MMLNNGRIYLVSAIACFVVAAGLAGCAANSVGHAIRAEYGAFDIGQTGLTLAATQKKISVANANKAESYFLAGLASIDSAETAYLAGNTSAAQIALTQAVTAIAQANLIMTPLPATTAPATTK